MTTLSCGRCPARAGSSNFDDYEDDSAEEWLRFNDKKANLFKGF